MTPNRNAIEPQTEHQTGQKTEQQLSPHQQRLHLLIAPFGQLSGDGQLRELIQERRNHLGEAAGIWYLAPQDLSDDPHSQLEGVACLEESVVIWLQLRFGGLCRQCPQGEARGDAPFKTDRLERLLKDLVEPHQQLQGIHADHEHVGHEGLQDREHER